MRFVLALTAVLLAGSASAQVFQIDDQRAVCPPLVR